MVLMIVESPVPFHWHETVAVPFMLWFEFCIGAEEVKRGRVIKSSYLHSILSSLHAHPPIPRVGAGMKVAIIDQSLDREANRTASSEHRVLYVSCILALSHPDSLFNQGIAQRKSPHGRRAFQTETLNVEITLGLEGKRHPAISSKRIDPAVVA